MELSNIIIKILIPLFDILLFFYLLFLIKLKGQSNIQKPTLLLLSSVSWLIIFNLETFLNYTFLTVIDYLVPPLISFFIILFFGNLLFGSITTYKKILLFIPIIFAEFIAAFLLINIQFSRVISYNLFYYSIYLVILITYFLIITSYLVLKKYRTVSGIRKIQIKYLIAGYYISIVPAMIASFYEAFIDTDPNKINFFNIVLVNFTIFFPLAITYVITRYRFMDIRVVIKKTVIHFLSFSTLIVLLIFLLFSINKYFLQNYNSVNVIVIEVILIVIFLPALKKMLLRIINKYIDRDEIDLSKNIEEFNREISYSNYLDDLMNKSVGFIRKELLIEKVDFIVRDFTKPELGYFFPLANKKILDDRMQEFLVNYFNNHKEILFKQELPFIKADKKYNKDLQEISLFLRKEGYEAIIAFKHWDVINGFLLLGCKNDGDVFSQEDARLLESLLNQVNIALFRVLSYEEAVGRVKREFGQNH